MTSAGCKLIQSQHRFPYVQAQQRYRERRKQRFQELEGTLDSMSAQLQQLQGVQQQNNALQARSPQHTPSLAFRGIYTALQIQGLRKLLRSISKTGFCQHLMHKQPVHGAIGRHMLVTHVCACHHPNLSCVTVGSKPAFCASVTGHC